MADDTSTKFRLDLDSEDFKKSLEEVNQKLDDIHGEGHKTALATMFMAFKEGAELALESIHKLGEAAEWVFDKVLEAEKLATVNFQFEQLSKNAGLSANELREGFEKAAKGLTPIAEILGVANKAMVNLATSSKQLPELFGMAQKIAASFGGTAIEKFEALTRAIEFGNQRMLRQANVLIDVDAAMARYAKSIGVAVDELTPALKQQALMNEVLAFGNNKLVETDAKLRQVTISWGRLKTAITEGSEQGAKSLSTILGPAISFVFDRLKNHIDTVHHLFAAFTSGSKEAEKGLRGVAGGMSALHDEEQKVSLERAEIDKARAKHHKAMLEAKAENDKKYHDENLKLEKEIVTAEEKGAKGSVAIRKASADKMKLIDMEYAQERRKILELELTDKSQQKNLELKAEQSHNAQVLEEDRRLQLALKADEKKTFDYKSASRDAFQLGFMNSMKAMGDGSKDASEAMASFFLQSIGTMAMNTGTFMVGEAFKTWPYVDPVLLGEGGGLIALGAALGAMSPAGSSGSGVGAAGGLSGNGGFTTNESPYATSGSSSTPEAGATPQTSKTVTIHVAGNYFETEETKRHLNDIIRQYQDATDYRFVQIGST